MSEQFECLSLIVRIARLSCLDLSQNSDRLITILIPIERQNSVQMGLGCLEVAHVKQYFGQAEKCLIIARIVSQ